MSVRHSLAVTTLVTAGAVLALTAYPSGSSPAAAATPTAAVAAAGGGNADSDSYAYQHPCSSQQLSITVTGRAGAPSQRVIAVRNHGKAACGLSYYPRVDLGRSTARDNSHNVLPLVPSGLGGPPAFPVHAGHTAYAVIDLDPSGATRGTVPGIDELNVLADGDHMANAETRNFPLARGTRVLRPKLGLYRDTVAAAVASMRLADTPPF
ncbi:DUF4232 domain-containing protein [Streptomyces sp. NPDC092296]|uniref:DUF4232 domain-containing protein n=1 Tax=Streptomyces sp. NPDC092296 TaxID=3366012 RepID=UPI0037F4D694